MRAKSLRVRRTKLRCSQYAVAKIAGISRNRLSLIECNYVTATGEELEKLQIALNEIEEGIRKSPFFKRGLNA
ncbi:MAG: helix-turn-helix transcriptional regulator [Bdellovibrionaceae bacterium]|nr:helix-turn-helix transcriptional regulator [Pseudobdellovibrionaceae bacterium]